MTESLHEYAAYCTSSEVRRESFIAVKVSGRFHTCKMFLRHMDPVQFIALNGSMTVYDENCNAFLLLQYCIE